MCEIEDLSVGHQDIYFNKYSDRFVSSSMDLYITDSLQDMLDIDIKSEMATDLGSGTDFTDAFGVSFSDLPPLLDIEMDNTTTWITGSNSSFHNSSNFVHNLDLYGSEANAVMVNPNSVMPSIFSESPVSKIVKQNSSNLMLNSVNDDSVSSSPPPSPVREKSHLTFSPDSIKVPVKQEAEEEEEEETAAGPGRPEPENNVKEIPNFVFIKSENIEHIKKDLNNDLDGKRIKVATPTTQTIRIKTAQPELIKLSNKNCSILNTNQRITGAQYVTAQTLGSKTIISGNIHILGRQQSRTLLTNSAKSPAAFLIDNGSLNNNRQIIKTTVAAAFGDNGNTKYLTGNKISFCGEFPKPAYSYSCLIAMALKNSRTGSLPVSEIYNFMCQHFPYFKTAPNGWKNSVRHNLSLNKCFEKIEKPTTNGGQRKGCLWAMNPTKVSKMDEEVQKWSRKDPQAIRKAMVRPDSLEALERGDMKYCSSPLTVNNDDDASEEEELEVDEAFLMQGSPADQQMDDETSDVEVMEGTYDEIDIEERKPIKFEFALASPFHTDSPAKRARTNYIYQTVSPVPHTNRRKTPLVNRIA